MQFSETMGTGFRYIGGINPDQCDKPDLQFASVLNRRSVVNDYVVKTSGCKGKLCLVPPGLCCHTQFPCNCQEKVHNTATVLWRETLFLYSLIKIPTYDVLTPGMDALYQAWLSPIPTPILALTICAWVHVSLSQHLNSAQFNSSPAGWWEFTIKAQGSL